MEVKESKSTHFSVLEKPCFSKREQGFLISSAFVKFVGIFFAQTPETP